jgi:membrane fusion protein (multidrug efflux system)
VRRGLATPLLAAALLACGESDSAVQVSAPPVTVAPVVVRELVEHIEAAGQLIAPDRAAIASEVSGRVTEIVIDEGSPAEAGAVILRIDPERRELELASARARLAEARASHADARRETKRARKLVARNVAAQTRLDQAEVQQTLAAARVDGAQAQLGVAERALADATITAPFAGMVADRRVSPGEYVQVGQALVELVALDPIEVEFSLAERDSSRVALGQTVDVRVSPYPDERFRALVTVISPTIDERTRTLRVKGRIENSDGRLRPGLFALADLGVSGREGVRMIPEEAVLQRSDGAVVFRLDGDVVERRVIVTGRFADGSVEVIEGLGEDDMVVVRGHAALLDGLRVSIRNADGSPTIAAPPPAEE